MLLIADKPVDVASIMSSLSGQHFVPSADVVTSIVLPTIVFCIGMVVAMLIGINKCKQWELDKIVEMRRTRLVIQRITARLQEKNFRTIQKARHMRKRAANSNTNSRGRKSMEISAPPAYSGSHQIDSSESPPPAYEDSLLDSLYYECMPSSSKTRDKSSWI